MLGPSIKIFLVLFNVIFGGQWKSKLEKRKLVIFLILLKCVTQANFVVTFKYIF
jgi:hypothetical protein